MFVRIDNTPRDYAWGSKTALAELLGRAPSGGPEAELWLGAHPGSPSRILDPSATGGAADLTEWIARDPVTALGEGVPGATDAPRLTFLLKVLAAAGPLSLQAHPSSQQALDGFERENAAGIALDAPDRNYKDPFHKPELIYALSERFEALCGFRPLTDSISDLDRLLAKARAAGSPSSALAGFRARLAVQTDAEQVLRDTVAWLLGGVGRGVGGEVAELVAQTVAAAALVVAESAGAGSGSGGADSLRPFVTVGVLESDYPGDAGVVLSLLLHRVTLKQGEALYLPAGNIHAYLEGLGVELMAASDNVLRGGLTPKHVDVPELLRVLQFAPMPVPYLQPLRHGDVETYRPDVPDFQLVRVVAGTDADDTDATEARVELAGPAIALCTAGSVRLRGAVSEATLGRGESAYVTPEEASVAVVGDGTVFFATGNL